MLAVPDRGLALGTEELGFAPAHPASPEGPGHVTVPSPVVPCCLAELELSPGWHLSPHHCPPCPQCQ